jgi:hypothetical protein
MAAVGDHRRQYSSLQFDLPDWLASRVRRWGRSHIPEDALFAPPDDPGYGRTDLIHCTVFWGIHTSDPERVRAALSGASGFTIQLGSVSHFSNSRFDVVKIDVTNCGDLYRLNQRVADRLEVTHVYPYSPHVTVAFVRPGWGRRLCGSRAFAGRHLWVNRLRFVGRTGATTWVRLGESSVPSLN